MAINAAARALGDHFLQARARPPCCSVEQTIIPTFISCQCARFIAGCYYSPFTFIIAAVTTRGKTHMGFHLETYLLPRVENPT